jgi:hypothetical protein
MAVFLEERNILVLKLHHLLGVILQPLYRVFSNPKKVIECDHRQVHTCLLVLGCSWLVGCLNQEFRDAGLDRELLTHGRVDLPVSVKHDLEAGQEAFGPNNLGRVGITGQRNCLTNGRNCPTDCAIFNLVSVAMVACTDLCCKPGEQSDMLCKAGVLKVRVHSHRCRVPLPVVPIFLLAAGSRLQSSSVKGVIPKTEITCIAIAEVGWKTVHEF